MTRFHCWMVFAVATLVISLEGAGAAPKGGGGGTLSAAVEFRAPGGGLDGDRVDSDGRGAYVDGRDKVSVKIDSSAHNNDVVMNLERTRGARSIFVDLTGCAEGTCDERPFDRELLWENTNIQTRAARLLDFPVGSTRPVRLWVKFYVQSTGWWLRLDAEDRETDCVSHNATATRTASDSWVISAGEGQVACLLTLTGDGKVARGTFLIPLEFTVRLK
jgi:hypothetical protein